MSYAVYGCVEKAFTQKLDWLAQKDTKNIRHKIVSNIRILPFAKFAVGLQRMIQERRAFLSELFVYHRDLVRPAVQKAQRARALRNSHVKAFHRR